MTTGTALPTRAEARPAPAARRRDRSGLAWNLVAAAVLLFLTAPSVIVAASSFSDTAYITFPPQGFTLRWYETFRRSEQFTGALQVSVLLAVEATALSLVVGGLAAFALDRYRFRFRDALVAAFLSPLVVPMIVIGIALLQFFARLGVPRSFELLLMGHLLICLPFIVRTVLSALAGFDRSIEEAAQNLGASPLRAILTVTLPNVAPGLLAAAIFAFIESFGNLTLSTFIAGPRVSTLPVRLFTYVEFAYDPVVTAISTVILAITLGLMLLLTRVASLERLF